MMLQLARRATLLSALALLVVLAPAASAQNIFQTVARINESVVTEFEVVQRLRLLQVLRQPGSDRDFALQNLIDDRLKLAAGREAGIEPTQEDLDFGLEDFAARANLTGPELIEALRDVGIEATTVRDFIRVQLVWGEVVRARFTARARPSEAEIDRALAFGSTGGATRVLLSEIILPMTPELAAASQERAAAIAEIDDFDAFASAARRFSVAESRANGGRLDWRALSELPDGLQSIFLTLQPGDVTPPIPLQGGIALFQLRALEDATPALSRNATVEYARVRFPPGSDLAAEEARIRQATDGCDDLYGVFTGAGPDRLIRDSAERASLPRDVANVTDRLDPGETAVIGPAGSGDGGSVVMLCGRTEIRDEDITRGDVERQLFNRRLEAYGESFLAQLRADAFIEVLE